VGSGGLVPGHVLKVGIAGLGTLGSVIAEHLDAGIPGLALVAVCSRDQDKARDRLARLRNPVPVVAAAELAARADAIVDAAIAKAFAEIAGPAIRSGKILVTLNAGALFDHAELIEQAEDTGARIVIPSGSAAGLDALRAAAEEEVGRVTLITRRPPFGLAGAPYLAERGISIEGLAAPLKVFEGSAMEGAHAFPDAMNIVAAVSFAGIGPERTRLEIWADPGAERNFHRLEVEAETTRFETEIDNVLAHAGARASRLPALSAIASLRGLVETLSVGV